MAAHVSPAFRVDLGDVVTVGAYSDMVYFNRVRSELDESSLARAMPTVIKNRSIQRVKGLEEQGLDQVLQQVLAVAVFPYYVPHTFIMFCNDEHANCENSLHLPFAKAST